MLGKLFGSQNRVKIIRLFLLNPEKIFSTDSVVRRSKVVPKEAKKEIAMLAEIKFIRSRAKAGEGGERSAKAQARGWQLDPAFPFIHALKLLLVNTVPFTPEEVVRRLKKAGKWKLVVSAGIFIQEDTSRADLLLVGDDIKRNVLDNAIRLMEAEIGRELTYGVFETDDFKYRYGVYDKFIRDILDYPHQKILDRLGIGTE